MNKAHLTFLYLSHTGPILSSCFPRLTSTTPPYGSYFIRAKTSRGSIIIFAFEQRYSLANR